MEVQSTIGSIEKLGFAGVILCYAKEFQLDETNAATGAQGQREADILAGHNSESIRKPISLAKEQAQRGESKVCPEFGQLQGMADDIGGDIVQFGEALQAESRQVLGALSPKQSFVPRAYSA